MSLSLPRTFLGLAIVSSALGLALGFLAHFLVTPRYVSTAALEVEDANGDADHSEWANHVRKLKDEITSPLVLSSVVYNTQAGAASAEAAAIERVRRNLDIQIGPYGTVRITFTDRDRIKTQMVVQAIVTRFVEQNGKRYRAIDLKHPDRPTSIHIVDPNTAPPRTPAPQEARRIAQLKARIAMLEQRLGIGPQMSSQPPDRIGPTGSRDLLVIDTPSLPGSPIYPDPFWFSAAGAGLGLLAAIAVTILRPRNPAIPRLPPTT